MHKSFERVKQEKTPEYKSIPYFTTKIDDRTITGIFSVFGNIDSYGDVVLPGSFEKTIAERGSKIMHLWSHDFASPPTAKITNIREVGRDGLSQDTLEAFPEATGGAEVTREYFATARADEVLTVIKSGAPLQMSYGYDAVSVSFGEQDGRQIRYLAEQRLWETSDVLFGANSATSAAKMPLETLLKHLEAIAEDMKSGARHSSADAKMINRLHDLTVDLGATTCKGVTGDDDGKSRSLHTFSEIQLPSTRKRQEPVAITGLWLRALGTSIQALVEIDEKWRLVIDEMTVAEIEGVVSHIVEPLGMRHAKPLDDTGKSDQSRAETSSLTLQARHRHLTSALALLGDSDEWVYRPN